MKQLRKFKQNVSEAIKTFFGVSVASHSNSGSTNGVCFCLFV